MRMRFIRRPPHEMIPYEENKKYRKKVPRLHEFKTRRD